MLGSVELMLVYVSKTKLWVEVEEYVFRLCGDVGYVCICGVPVWAAFGYGWMCSRCCMEGLEAI